MTRRTVIVVAALVVFELAAGSFAAYAAFREDTGVTACKAFAEGTPFKPAEGKTPADRYRALRHQFSDSRHEELRTNGTKFVDLAWQVLQADDSMKLGLVMTNGGEITRAYGSLTGACAEHGVTLKPLGS